jgi:hypothetical protein
MTALIATTAAATSHPTDGAACHGKRAQANKNGKTNMPKAVITCPVCKKDGHDANRSWFNAKNKLREAVKMKSDAQDIFKSTKSTEEACVACLAANQSHESCCNCVSLKCERTCAD